MGSVAYGHGISIRKLKALNDLSNEVLRVGQVLRVSDKTDAGDVKREEEQTNGRTER